MANCLCTLTVKRHRMLDRSSSSRHTPNSEMVSIMNSKESEMNLKEMDVDTTEDSLNQQWWTILISVPGMINSCIPFLVYYTFITRKGGLHKGYSAPLPNDFIFCRCTALHVYFILVYLCLRTMVVVFEQELFKGGWGNSVY